MAKKKKEPRYTVFNATDGFFASPDTFTEKEADEFIKNFPDRFKTQGYYRTGSGERIDPKDVILEKYHAQEAIFTDGPVELATKLAHQRTLAAFDPQDSVLEDVDDDETRYTDAAQEVFDEFYDYYYDLLINE